MALVLSSARINQDVRSRPAEAARWDCRDGSGGGRTNISNLSPAAQQRQVELVMAEPDDVVRQISPEKEPERQRGVGQRW